VPPRPLGPLEELFPTSQPVPTARSCHGDPLPPSATVFPVKPLHKSILPDRHAPGPPPPSARSGSSPELTLRMHAGGCSLGETQEGEPGSRGPWVEEEPRPWPVSDLTNFRKLERREASSDLAPTLGLRGGLAGAAASRREVRTAAVSGAGGVAAWPAGLPLSLSPFFSASAGINSFHRGRQEGCFTSTSVLWAAGP
jgi:hypothetical protein